MLTTSEVGGTVTALPDPQHTGLRPAVTVLKDLNGPHGIAFHQGRLYVAESLAWSATTGINPVFMRPDGAVIAKLPESGEHMTWTILFAATSSMSPRVRVVTCVRIATLGVPRFRDE